MTIRDAIARVLDRHDLTEEEAADVMTEIMTGTATEAQLGAFLIALRVKGETDAEIAGMAGVMRDMAVRVPYDGPLLDTCGTGGDGSGSFNVSTAAAFVAAGAGAKVAKHGNRALSSKAGSADVLEALGAKVEQSPEQVARAITEAGVGFMFAPAYHPAMKHAAGPRREIGVRTVFNILGPLTNPAHAKAQVVGVPAPDLGERIAHTLRRLGSKHALVVHGEDGLDELTTTAGTLVWELQNGAVRHYRITPGDLGLAVATPEALKGADAAANASAMRALLAGGGPAALRDIVLLNAAAALLAADIAPNLAEGLRKAREALDSGAAQRAMERFVEVTNRR
ncbi:MAG: anthranilate phosphoribosyltransferase [Dehalococcoidia bacterium]|nr:anthranilate phosphoribosyltransferase [Dehalococcoidia bacterium]